ncbi:ribosome silencing factor [Herbaspirillum sp. RTI4]|uniref:ribosome silencing factor n=1 Tax=Herbaspirillum sp. RTI4 TaxID=3048640 RepID=UPI002AB41549|nr:ribosome silencing factor [Herbaspirillum sp. RTI4]MDY7580009.1 ribosome silencing factor [Herbaspirillum sp. RTI4]MEA9982823.1 ribosome silencing factor [Herbaspirillum sp. RTI4]
MDIKKLQALVVDALEDVKAQDIMVFDTTHLTSLFDRVAVASGTSNRQTKALAASVRDKVKENGGVVLSVEGGDTGEWVLVDLGDMVVHVMQPAIRAYYRLEEIWGEKPVKFGAAKRTGSSASAKKEEELLPKKTRHLTVNQSDAVTPKKPGVRKTAAAAAPAEKPAKKAPAKTTRARPVAEKVAAKSAVKPAAKSAGKPETKTSAPRKPVASKAVGKKIKVSATKSATASKAASKAAPAARKSPTVPRAKPKATKPKAV